MAGFIRKTLILVVLAVFCQPSTQKQAQDYRTLADCIASLPPYGHQRNQVPGKMWYTIGASQRASARYVSWHAKGAPDDVCLITSPCLKADFEPSDPFLWTARTCNNVNLKRTYATVPYAGYNVSYILQDGSLRTALWRIVQSGKDYNLHYNCYDDGTKDFELYSLERSISAESLKEVNDRLDVDGWDRMERVRPYVAENCPP